MDTWRVDFSFITLLRFINSLNFFFFLCFMVGVWGRGVGGGEHTKWVGGGGCRGASEEKNITFIRNNQICLFPTVWQPHFLLDRKLSRSVSISYLSNIMQFFPAWMYCQIILETCTGIWEKLISLQTRDIWVCSGTTGGKNDLLWN